MNLHCHSYLRVLLAFSIIATASAGYSDSPEEGVIEEFKLRRILLDDEWAGSHVVSLRIGGIVGPALGGGLRGEWGSINEADLRSIEKLPKLQRLSIEWSNITAGALQSITSLNSLEYLGLVGTTVANQDAMHLGELKDLRKLDLRGTGLESNIESLLRRSLPNCVVLSGPSWEHSRAVELAELFDHRIRVSNLRDMRMLSDTQALVIGNDVSAETMLAATQIKGVVRLYFDESPAETIQLVSKTPQIEVLWLRRVTMSPEAWAAIGELKDLKTLVLSEVELPSASASTAISKLTQLRTLQFGNSSVNESVRAAIESLPNLVSLEILDATLTDDDIWAFHKRISLSKLRVGRSSKVTTTGVHRLKEAIPGLVVVGRSS